MFTAESMRILETRCDTPSKMKNVFSTGRDVDNTSSMESKSEVSLVTSLLGSVESGPPEKFAPEAPKRRA